MRRRKVASDDEGEEQYPAAPVDSEDDEYEDSEGEEGVYSDEEEGEFSEEEEIEEAPKPKQIYRKKEPPKQPTTESKNIEEKKEDPALVPTTGRFFMHDDRTAESKDSRRQPDKEIWEPTDNDMWTHDKFDEPNVSQQQKRRGRGGGFNKRGSRKPSGRPSNTNNERPTEQSNTTTSNRGNSQRTHSKNYRNRRQPKPERASESSQPEQQTNRHSSYKPKRDAASSSSQTRNNEEESNQSQQQGVSKPSQKRYSSQRESQQQNPKQNTSKTPSSSKSQQQQFKVKHNDSQSTSTSTAHPSNGKQHYPVTSTGFSELSPTASSFTPSYTLTQGYQYAYVPNYGYDYNPYGYPMTAMGIPVVDQDGIQYYPLPAEYAAVDVQQTSRANGNRKNTQLQSQQPQQSTQQSSTKKADQKPQWIPKQSPRSRAIPIVAPDDSSPSDGTASSLKVAESTSQDVPQVDASEKPQ